MVQILIDWLTIAAAGWLVVMSPGPNFFITLRNSLGHSRQAGVATALGLAIGDLVHLSYCLVGIGVIIAKSLLLLNLIKWLGAIYLIYIGVQSLRAKKHQGPAVEVAFASQLGPVAAFRIGFLTCLLNPKVTLFFLALFTQIIRPDTSLPLQVAYGLTVVGIEFFWFALVAVAVSQAAIKRRFLAIGHWIERIMGAVLIGLGLRLAVAKASE